MKIPRAIHPRTGRPVLVLTILLGVGLAGVATRLAYAHCQIPCGIYGDQTRFEILGEHITTIEKSIAQINALAGAHSGNEANQLVRWVQNKEEHADELAHIVSYYFLQQRVKPADASDKAAYDKYITQLTLCHQLLIGAMKAKQSADPATAESLKKTLAEFRVAYLDEEMAAHLMEDHPVAEAGAAAR
jgi:nickel superoxide dismutase